MKRGEILQWQTLTINALVLQWVALPIFLFSFLDGTSCYCHSRNEPDSSAAAATAPLLYIFLGRSNIRQWGFSHLETKGFKFILSKISVLFDQLQQVQLQLSHEHVSRLSSIQRGAKRKQEWERARESCRLLFFSPCSKTPRTETEGSFTSREHTVSFKCPFCLISQFINSQHFPRGYLITRWNRVVNAKTLHPDKSEWSACFSCFLRETRRGEKSYGKNIK